MFSRKYRVRRRYYWPTLESFEDRLAPAVFTVVNTTGNLLGSLRQAILDANNTPNVGGVPDEVHFNIPGGGVQTLHPNASLPALTEAVIIDGYTQPGASANTLAVGDNAVLKVEIDCSSLPSSDDLFILGGDGSTIRGLVINHADGFAFNTSGNVAFNNNTITGNFIGSDATGAVYQGGNNNGIRLLGSGNHIGGTNPADRNIITGPGSIFDELVALQNGSANFIQNNYIGLNAAGTAALKPSTFNASIYIGMGSGSNTISGNVILSTSVGIELSGNGTGGNIVQGNFIGTNATGTAGLGGSGTGIDIQSPNDTISGNLISGNGTGIWIAHTGNPGSGPVIRGNRIGTDNNGVSAIPNTNDGIFVSFDLSNQGAAIGGTGPSDGNTIAFNGGHGVFVDNNSGWSILGNSIFANGKRGIGLHNGPGDTQTVNDPGDADTGVNGLQNYPVLTSAGTSAGTTTVAGTLNSTPNTTFRIEFFAGNVPDPTGFGEGKTYLGFTNVTTDASGDASYNVSFPTVAGNIISATATDPGGNTSEFSHVLGASSLFVVTNTNADGPGSLRQAMLDAEATQNIGGPDRITFNIPGSGVHTIFPGLGVPSPLPTITEAVIIDGYTQPGASPNTLAVGDNAVLTIEINGSNMTSGANLFLINGSNDCTIRGLAITHVPQASFVLGFFGQQANHNTIAGNFIGTDAGGLAYQAGDGPAIRINAGSNNMIGGPAPADRNVIAPGMFTGSAAITLNTGMGNVVQGNYIGVNKDGAAPLLGPFGGFDIEVGGGSGNIIGGAAPGAGNVIVGAAVSCIRLSQQGVAGQNLIQGNFIGTNATGTAGLGGGFVGVDIQTDSDTITGNLISGFSRGIAIVPQGTAVNNPGPTIRGNKIGTDITGTLAIPNGNGILCQAGSGGATIGGVTLGAGNTIAFNNENGVRVITGTGVEIIGNSIFANGALGIDLSVGGFVEDAFHVNANDTGDADTGVNNQQNYPVITSVTFGSPNTTVNGTLNTTPSATIRIAFYANADADPSGFGEGKRYLGFENVLTDGAGNVNFNATKLGATTASEVITATATDLTTNDTSEFAKAFPPRPNIFVVTNTNDSGPGSLRQALQDAESKVNVTFTIPDEIHFNIPDGGVHTINPGGSLPIIADPVIIDGYTQSGASVNTLAVGDNAVLTIEINGSAMPAGTNLFNMRGDNSTIRGLAITHVPGISFSIGSGGFNSNNNTIAGNFIGTDAGGSTYLGDNGLAIQVGNSSLGVQTNGNVIGGTAPADRNVISSAGAAMILLRDAHNNLIQGNYIGVNKDGTAPLQPAVGSIGVGVGNGASDNIIGGTTPGASNVILGTDIGIGLFQGGTGNNIIQGNFIGTNATGMAGLGGGIGIQNNSANNTIGGSASGAGNLISGNATGIFLLSASPGPTIRGNKIGTDVTGALAIPNSADGINIVGSGGATIGGTSAGDGNTIAFNGGAGVLVQSGSGWSILGNSIFANGKRGIRLFVDSSDTQTVNDPGDADTGANGLQNYPVLTSVTSSGNTTITGTLNSTPSAFIRIEFFASSAPDPSGFGEGKRFLGFKTVATDLAGDAPFTATGLGVTTSGEFITATATDLDTHDTSEFAKSFAMAAAPPPCVVNNTIVINSGAAQRSRLTSIAIPFDQIISLPANPALAFELKRQSDGALAGFLVGADNSTGKTVVTLTPSGALSEFGSLQDGRYTLTIFADQVSGLGGQLDGNCDGSGGDNFVLIGTPANGLFRLAGDADGNASVTASDFNAFRLAYGSSGPSVFDFDGDNQVSASDFNQFRTRYGVTLVP